MTLYLYYNYQLISKSFLFRYWFQLLFDNLISSFWISKSKLYLLLYKLLFIFWTVTWFPDWTHSDSVIFDNIFIYLQVFETVIEHFKCWLLTKIKQHILKSKRWRWAEGLMKVKRYFFCMLPLTSDFLIYDKLMNVIDY